MLFFRKYIFVFIIIILSLSLYFINQNKDYSKYINCILYKDNECETDNENIDNFINDIFLIKSKALLDGDLKCFSTLYDRNSKYGQYAYEYEEKKVKYLKNWSEKQGITFTKITPVIHISKNSKVHDNSAKYNVFCKTKYSYFYNNDTSKTENTFDLGTSHCLALKKKDNSWIITKEWYKDPFGDSLCLENIKSRDIKEYINNHEKKDMSDLNDNRKKAVCYAEKYCGASNSNNDFYKYNTKYRNFNSEGGDCANFASQILYESGRFKKNNTWNYNKGEASGSWINAGTFTHYMLYSGRASLIAKGSYNEIYKSSYKLLPGDFIAYEKKNDITHVSVVTDTDSKGYALVTCHNTDRNNVPWDLGWSNKNIKFYLIRVHF